MIYIRIDLFGKQLFGISGGKEGSIRTPSLAHLLLERENVKQSIAQPLPESRIRHKVCTACGNDKPYTEFHKGAGKFGKKPKCAQCCRSYQNDLANKNRAKEVRKEPELKGLQKVCTGCKKEKFYSEYHESPQGRGGRSSKCKVCRRAYQKVWGRKKRAKLKAQKN